MMSPSPLLCALRHTGHMSAAITIHAMPRCLLLLLLMPSLMLPRRSLMLLFHFAADTLMLFMLPVAADDYASLLRHIVQCH